MIYFVVGFVVYIRYKQVEAYFRFKPAGIWMPRINMGGLIMGMVSALGVTVVGAFQETNVFTIHVVGAFMSFLGGSIYFCFQVSRFPMHNSSIQNNQNTLFQIISYPFQPGLLYF